MQTIQKAQQTQHTSGPWHAVAGPSAFIRLADADNETIARLYRDDVPDWRTNEANARLIAAAPELYQAARAAAIYLMQSNDYEKIELSNELWAAIRKAEGREQ